MIILCKGDFKEQLEKLVILLLYTIESCWRKYQVGIFCTQSANTGVKEHYAAGVAQ